MGRDREGVWLQRVRDLALRLSTADDLKLLLPEVLDAAIELTEAERGFLVLVEGEDSAGKPKTRVAQARGFDKAALQSSQVKVSRTVVRRVVAENRALVTTSDSVDADVMQVSSVRDGRVRSIACVPLRLRGELRGALYLDHRFVEEAFSEEDVPLLEIFASQAALALEWARLRAQGAEAERAVDDARRRLGVLAADDRPAPAVDGSIQRYGLLVGGSPAMLALYEEIERAARTDDPVLLLGETGTGHELVARELHARGAAPEAPFVVQTCALSTRDLVRSLFGGPDCVGILEQVGAGTVLLDDVDQLTPDMQTKLLEVLRRKTWPGLAGELPLRARLVAASHADLLALVDEGELREDLYYRLDVMRIIVPPLRQRTADVALLVEHFLAKSERRPEISSHAVSLMEGYGWPGNVRELENQIRRLCAAGARRVSANHLDPAIREGRGVSAPRANFSGLTLEQAEAEMVKRALEASGGNKARAARQLGVPRSTLYHLLDRHGL